MLAQSECFLIDDDYNGTERCAITSDEAIQIDKNKSPAMTNNNHKIASNYEKFVLLMWKNWLLQKRNKIQTIAELLIPIILVVILVVIRSRVQPIEFKNATTYESFQLNPFIRNEFDHSNKTDTLKLVFWPENHLFKELLREATGEIPIGVSNSTTIAYYVKKRHCIAGVEFYHSADINELPDNLNYSLRFPSTWRDNSTSIETWQTHDLYPKKTNGARNRNSTYGGPPSYRNRGFLFIQDAIARAYIRLKCKSNNDYYRLFAGCEHHDQLPQIFMRRYPYPPYTYDDLIKKMSTILPFFILLCFCYPAINTVRFIALEKERNLKEAMKIMGLPNWLHWTSWFVRTILLMIIMITMIVLLLKMQMNDFSIAVVTYSDWTVLWMLFFVYSISMTTYCFMLSVFFSSASSASAVSGLFWFILYLPYFISVRDYEHMTYTSKIITGFPSNSAMAYAVYLIIKFESNGEGLQWSNLSRPVNGDDKLTVGTTICMMLISSAIYVLIALYAEKVVPGSFGISEKWYFPLTKEFWFGRSINKETETPTQNLPQGPNFERESKQKHTGIQIINLRKEYANGKVACRDLSLNMYEDQITVLLGHNGAGKTTTITTLIGMIEPTSGTAIINGHDIRKNPQKAINSIGFCPQHEILYDELTVREHIVFYSQLKGLSGAQIENEVNKYITLLELEPKADARSDTLSGGMKRKLSVGVALCGGSKVVLCDEPSSGMDPAARRALWDLLQKEKLGRTILLTTHFMDEADVLGDRIAIMADGELQCCGSSFFLKKRFGTGYHLVCVKNENCVPTAVTYILQKYIPNIEIQSEIGHELTYELPEDGASMFQEMFNDLEQHRDNLGVDSFGLSLTTMEDVFLKVGSDSLKLDKLVNANDCIVTASEDWVNDSSVIFNDEDSIIEREMSLRDGFRLSVNQLYAMLKKKFICWKRSWILFLIQNSIPVSCILATVWIYQMVKINEELPPLKISFDSYDKTVTLLQRSNETELIRRIFGNYATASPRHEVMELNTDIENYFLDLAAKRLVTVNSQYLAGLSFNSTTNAIIAWFNNQLFHTSSLSLNAIHNAMIKESFDSNHSIHVINWPLPYDEDSLDHLLTSKNDIGHKIAMNLSICMAFVAAFYVMPQIKERMSKAKLLQYVSGLRASVYWFSTFIFDFCTYLITILITLATVLYFREEGWSNVGQLEPAAVIFICFGFSTMPLTYILSRFFTTHSVGFIRLIVIYMLTGIAIYMIVSLLKVIEFDDEANAMKWIFMIFPHYSLSDGLIFVNENNTMRQICSEMCDKDTKNIKPNMFCNNIALDPAATDDPCKAMATHLPPDFEHFCYQSIRGMSITLSSKLQCQHIIGEYTGCSLDVQCQRFKNNCCFSSYYDWDYGILKNIVYIVVSGIVYFILLMMMENRPLTRLYHYYFIRKLRNPPSCEQSFAEDDDVKRENAIVHAMDEADLDMNNLVLKELTRFYGRFFAVNGISARVKHSEVFGLLGINGAGKTTTFKMLTGDVKISKGDAYVRGISLRDDISTAQRLFGYCPQFDALIPELTGRETLEMFARLRGIRSNEIKALTIRLAVELNFMKHIDNKVIEYSGGNKRKLSTAVALIGNPFVVYLDEPTTGMDPGAKRHLWNVISNLRRSGKTIVMTSHSMEECEALCTRLAIMVNGEFKCLGSIQHLKNKFSNGYLLMVKARRHFEADHSRESTISIDEGAMCPSTEELTRIKDFIANNFPGAALKEEYQGLLTYHIPTSGSLKWSQMFGLMEKGKQDYQIEDYSIGQTSLEQVFLSFTKYQLEDLK